MMNDAPGTTRVSIAIPGKAAADMAVPADRVIDFATEERRRGLLVKYRLQGSKMTSTVMPPGQVNRATESESRRQVRNKAAV